MARNLEGKREWRIEDGRLPFPVLYSLNKITLHRAALLTINFLFSCAKFVVDEGKLFWLPSKCSPAWLVCHNQKSFPSSTPKSAQEYNKSIVSHIRCREHSRDRSERDRRLKLLLAASALLAAEIFIPSGGIISVVAFSVGRFRKKRKTWPR